MSHLTPETFFLLARDPKSVQAPGNYTEQMRNLLAYEGKTVTVIHREISGSKGGNDVKLKRVLPFHGIEVPFSRSLGYNFVPIGHKGPIFIPFLGGQLNIESILDRDGTLANIKTIYHNPEAEEMFSLASPTNVGDRILLFGKDIVARLYRAPNNGPGWTDEELANVLYQKEREHIERYHRPLKLDLKWARDFVMGKAKL